MGDKTSESDYMRRWEAAKHLQVSPRTLARWIVRGHIPYIRVGSRLMLFRKSDLDRTMERFKTSFASANRVEWRRPQSFRWARYSL